MYIAAAAVRFNSDHRLIRCAGLQISGRMRPIQIRTRIGHTLCQNSDIIFGIVSIGKTDIQFAGVIFPLRLRKQKQGNSGIVRRKGIEIDQRIIGKRLVCGK